MVWNCRANCSAASNGVGAGKTGAFLRKELLIRNRHRRCAKLRAKHRRIEKTDATNNSNQRDLRRL